MSIQLIILVAAIVVSWLVFSWLVNVVKTTISTAITIAVLLLLLQIVFGIGPTQIWHQATQLPQYLWNLTRGGR